MTKAERRQLERFVGTGPACAVNLAAYLKSKAPKRKPASYQKQKTLSRKGARAALMFAVRTECVRRANGVCECGCGAAFLPFGEQTAELDEFYGRRHLTAAESWLITRACHRAKTQNDPSRETWDRRFKDHCWLHDLPFRRRFCKPARQPSLSEPHDRMERSVETAGGRSTSVEAPAAPKGNSP